MKKHVNQIVIYEISVSEAEGHTKGEGPMENRGDDVEDGATCDLCPDREDNHGRDICNPTA